MNSNGEQQPDLSAQLVDLARRYPGQPASIVFDGEKFVCGVLSISELKDDDWMKGPVTIIPAEMVVSLAL